MERREGGWEKESGACALKPWLSERLSSKNMASHPLLSHGTWHPLVPQASLGVRYQKQLPEWVVPLSLLVPLQVTPAATQFIHPASFSRRSYYPLQLPLPEPDSCTGVQARATGTAVGVSLAIVERRDWPLPIGLPTPAWLVDGLGDIQHTGRGRLAVWERTR